VELLSAALEPATAARTERGGLFQFLHAKERAIEFAGSWFASFGSGNLDVVKTGDACFHRPTRIPVCGGFYSACEFARAIT